MNEFSHAFLFSHLWSHRGYIPHFQGTAIQFLTYRLSDSLPRSVIKRIQFEAQRLEPDERSRYKFVNVEKYLDKGRGCCVLRNPKCANVVIDAWMFFDGERYDLLDWVVMPNHVHLIIALYPGWKLSAIMQSWKTFTAKRILEVADEQLFPERRVWQPGYFDRIVRDPNHYERVSFYIRDNPRRAGLVEDAADWDWSSG